MSGGREAHSHVQEGSGPPGQVREGPSSSTAWMHLKYSLPSHSSASSVRSLSGLRSQLHNMGGSAEQPVGCYDS